MNSKKPEPVLLLSDARGVFIPRDFINEVRPDCLSGVSEDDAAILRAGPNNEFYWDAWYAVEQSATVTDPTTGVVYHVYQDGDCWLVPEGMSVDDSGAFYWEDDRNA